MNPSSVDEEGDKLTSSYSDIKLFKSSTNSVVTIRVRSSVFRDGRREPASVNVC